MAVDIAYDDILVMGDQIHDLILLYKEYAEEDVKRWLMGTEKHESIVRGGIWCDFWNRGYPIKVNKVKLRESDKSVMVCGENLATGKDDDEEFFSYICNFRQMQQIVAEVIPSV